MKIYYIRVALPESLQFYQGQLDARYLFIDGEMYLICEIVVSSSSAPAKELKRHRAHFFLRNELPPQKKLTSISLALLDIQKSVSGKSEKLIYDYSRLSDAHRKNAKTMFVKGYGHVPLSPPICSSGLMKRLRSIISHMPVRKRHKWLERMA